MFPPAALWAVGRRAEPGVRLSSRPAWVEEDGMATFSVGDKVRILELEYYDPVWNKNHKNHKGRDGEVKIVDESDNTVIVSFKRPDGRNDWIWFHQAGLERMVPKMASDFPTCVCGGPERIVMILWQAVKVFRARRWMCLTGEWRTEPGRMS
jgi:hypothetical protein